MELIQIDSLQTLYTGPRFQHCPDLAKPVLLDTETGVVYFNGDHPRYDSNGRIMIIPRDQIPGLVERAREESRRPYPEY